MFATRHIVEKFEIICVLHEVKIPIRCRSARNASTTEDIASVDVCVKEDRNLSIPREELEIKETIT